MVLESVMRAPPVRVVRRRARGWRMPPNTVSVARPSVWGNPWIVGVDGDAQYCVDEYRRLLTGVPYLHEPSRASSRFRVTRFGDDAWAKVCLRGKNLACFCEIGDPCHVDVLLEVANS